MNIKKYHLILSTALIGISCMGEIVIVKKQTAHSVIVRGNNTMICKMAVDTLQKNLEKSSGAKLKVFSAAKISSIPEKMNRIIVGDCAYARSKGIIAKDMLPEQYIVKASGKDLFLLGHNKISKGSVTGAPSRKHPKMDYRQVSPATLWAANAFLDRIVGVRYLWPGEKGIYVPRKTTIEVPQKYFLQERPPLERRQFWFAGKNTDSERDAMNTFLMNHQQGSRIKTNFVHAFDHWWKRYSKKHPEIFAKSPEGKRIYPYGKPVLAKFCISNPQVEKLMLKEWRDAGKPDLWNIGTNDGPGFCTCEKCRKLDDPQSSKYTAEQIWRKKADLSRRYVQLWNRLMKQMKKENPKVKLFTFGYGAYKKFPENMHLEDGFLVAVVPPDYEKEGINIWKGWGRSGAELFLRPNWWHTLWLSPYLPLDKAGKYFRMAKKNKMVGYEFDAVNGTWGTQAPYYYLIARMSYRPDLTIQQIKEEFASAFGKGAPEILKYLDYWESYTDKVGSGVVEEENTKAGGLYSKVCKKYRLRNSPLYGTWETLPYLYPDKVIAPAEKLLDQAGSKIDPSNKDALYKLKFLKDGLKHMKATRDCVSSFRVRPVGKTQQHKDNYAKLLELREELSKRHVIWGKYINHSEKVRHIQIVPK